VAVLCVHALFARLGFAPVFGFGSFCSFWSLQRARTRVLGVKYVKLSALLESVVLSVLRAPKKGQAKVQHLSVPRSHLALFGKRISETAR
jgi:hypothetical protein